MDSAGRIYVVGYFEWNNSFPALRVNVFARLRADGSLDSGFNPTLPADIEEFRGVVVDAQDRVTVLGRYESPATSTYLQRFNADGSVDGSFTLDAAAGVVTARPLQLQADKILLAKGCG